MPETNQGNDNLFDKIGKFRRRILPTPAEAIEREQENKRAEFEKSYREVYDQFSLHSLYLAINEYGKYDITGGVRTAEMIKSAFDLIDSRKKHAKIYAPHTKEDLPSLLPSTIDFLILTNSVGLSDEIKLGELKDKGRSLLSDTLSRKPDDINLFSSPIQQEVQGAINKLQRKKTEAGTAKDCTFLDESISELESYQKWRIEQEEKEFELAENMGDVFKMYLAFKRYASWTGETDSPKLRVFTRRAGMVMEKFALGQLPAQPDYPLGNAVSGATEFLITASGFDYHQSSAEFGLFREVAKGFSDFATSKRRRNFENSPVIGFTVESCQRDINTASANTAKKYAHRVGFNQQIAAMLKKCAEDLEVVKTPMPEIPAVDRRKELLFGAVAVGDFAGLRRTIDKIVGSDSPEDKEAAILAVNESLSLLEKMKGKLYLVKEEEFASVVDLACQLVKSTSGIHKNNPELEKKKDRAFGVFQELLSIAKFQRTGLSPALSSVINENIMLFELTAQRGIDKQITDVFLRCSLAERALSDLQSFLSPQKPETLLGLSTVSAGVWDADKRRDLTRPEAVVVLTKVEIPPYGIGDEIVMGDDTKYRVEGINVGGQFVVYKARVEINGIRKIVCLRTEKLDLKEEDRMKPELIAASLGIMQYLRKGAPDKIAQRIHEPHGIHYDKDGKWYFQLAWIEGESLQDEMDQVPKMDEDRVKEIVKKVAETLVHVNLVKEASHCDIKPANIMIIPNGEIVLVDYDIAKKLDPKTGRAKTAEIICTPPYAASEQFAGVITTKTDCHAVGVMIYEMLTGEGQTLNAENGYPLLTNNNVEARFPKIWTLPEKWRVIIENCTYHDASRRWDVKQLLDALNAPDVPNVPKVREPFSLD